MRLILSLLVSALLAIPFQTPSFAQQPQAPTEARFGFVIGNDEYAGAALPTAANDAALVADALKSAGFDVTGARNLDADTFRSAYREFLEKVEAAGPGAVAAIYLSGYGMQSDGENYLVPPGARIAREADLALAGIRLSDLTRPLSGLQNRAKIFLFDLAYASPFAKEASTPPGLALVDPDRGSLIGFNAGPGEVAPAAKPPYGPYAQALAEMLRQPGLDLNEVMVRVRARTAELTGGAQVPWHVSKIEPPLTLFERGAGAPAPQIAPQAVIERRNRPMRELSPDEAYAAALELDTPRGYEDFLAAFPSSPYARNVRGMLAARREAATWRRSLIVNSPDSYWSYLRRYPRGPHAAEARRRLARLSAPIEAPPTFAEITYDIGPPPQEEMVFFEGSGGPVYFDAAVPPPPAAVFMAPAPAWWRPPPPPAFVDGSDYFLPEPEVIPAPAWVSPPAYVAAPPPPIVYEDDRPSGASILPYVAIPAALAAGIVAGRLINKPGRPPAAGMPPNIPGGPTTMPLGARPLLPPVAAPPSAVKPGTTQAIGLQPGAGALRPAPMVVKGNAQQLLTPGAAPVPAPGQPSRPLGQPQGQPGAPVTTAPIPVPGQPQTGRPPLPGVQPNAPTATAPVPGAQPARPPGAPGALPGQQPTTTAPVPGVPQPGRQPLPGLQPGAPAATAPVPGAQPGGRPPGVPGQPAPGQPATNLPAPGAQPGRQPLPGLQPGAPAATAPVPGVQPGGRPPGGPVGQPPRPLGGPTTTAPAPLAVPPSARPMPGPNPAAQQQQMLQQQRQMQEQQQRQLREQQQQQQRQQEQSKQQQRLLEQQQRQQRQDADKQRQQMRDQQRLQEQQQRQLRNQQQQQIQQQRQQQQMQQQQQRMERQKMDDGRRQQMQERMQQQQRQMQERQQQQQRQQMQQQQRMQQQQMQQQRQMQQQQQRAAEQQQRLMKQQQELQKKMQRR